MSGSTLSLSQKQKLFADACARLIVWIRQQGWAVSFGESYDDDGVGHMKGSLHYQRLAADLNLFVGGSWDGHAYVGGKYVSDGEHPAWKAIGAKWKSMHPEFAWGGDFGDANHVSIRHDGKA